MSNQKRFVDEGTSLWQFSKAINVVCPNCQQCALASSDLPALNAKNVTLACSHCGYFEKMTDSSWRGQFVARINHKCGYCGSWLDVWTTSKKRKPKAQVVCERCQSSNLFEADWQKKRDRDVIDPYFGLQLWWATSFRGERLWAYNREHLTFLKQLIGADLREATVMSSRTLSNALPKWMLDKKNRAGLLKAIAKLERE